MHLVYYSGQVDNWDCVQYIFFAKFQPSITYQHQYWRLLASSLMFRGWIQFYFNNFALNMLGYVVEKQSKAKFVIVFYTSILCGHLLSCCLSSPSQLTVGTSCGTIGLLPLEICRFIRLRKTNPIQAQSRRNFLIFNILSNIILNILAVFHLDAVDWVSHVGCLISGLLFLAYYEMKNIELTGEFINNSKKLKTKIIKNTAIITLVLFCISMILIVSLYLPAK